MKKIFIAIIVCFCCSFFASAQYNAQTNTYTLQDKDVSISNGIITACSTSASDWGTGKLIIPETLQGQKVLEIADGDNSNNIFGNKGIKELQLSVDILSIGSFAFFNNSIQALIFPQKCKIRCIGVGAFAKNKLLNIVIPRSVTYINESAFSSNELTNVVFEEKSFIRIICRCFDTNPNLQSITLPSNANPGFKGYNKLHSGVGVQLHIDPVVTDFYFITYIADLPPHVLTKEEVEFKNGGITQNKSCYSNLVFPDNFEGENLYTIGGRFGVFIESVKLPNTLDSVLNGAFSEDIYNSVSVPSNLKFIDQSGFTSYNSPDLAVSFEENSSLSFIGKFGFDCFNATEITLPRNVIKEGYLFTAWKNSRGNTVTSVTDRMTSTYTAQFTPTPSHIVSGKITSSNTAGLHLVLSGDFKGYRYTNSDGSFSFPLNAGRTMTLTPEKEGYVFTPASRTITNLQAATANLDFTASPSGACVSGSIDIDDPNMWLQVSGDVTCAVKLQADGTYTLPLNIGRSVTIMPVKDGYMFTPQSITVNNVQNCVTGVNFTTKTDATITQRIQLEKGWNLISVNLLPDNTGSKSFPVASLFAGLDVETIKTMDSFWTKNQSDALNGLKTITAGEGYLVKMNAAATLTVSGTPIASSSNFQITSSSNWQLIGCPFQAATAISSVLDASKCSCIKNFKGFWKPAGGLNSISSFEPGMGYFIKK